MPVKDDNTRIIVTIPKSLKKKLDLMCLKDKRTMSKEVEFILEKYIVDQETNCDSVIMELKPMKNETKKQIT